VAFVVLDQADDLEAQRGAVLHVQLEDVLEVERLLLAAAAVAARAGGAVGFDDGLLI
jgi:hypothetical protein